MDQHLPLSCDKQPSPIGIVMAVHLQAAVQLDTYSAAESELLVSLCTSQLAPVTEEVAQQVPAPILFSGVGGALALASDEGGGNSGLYLFVRAQHVEHDASRDESKSDTDRGQALHRWPFGVAALKIDAALLRSLAMIGEVSVAIFLQHDPGSVAYNGAAVATAPSAH